MIKAFEDRPLQAECSVTQARPAARIIWVVAMDKEGQRIAAYINNASLSLQEVGVNSVRGQRNYEQKVIELVDEDDDGYITTTSTLSFSPNKADDKKYLVCLTIHPTFGQRTRSAASHLNVLYKPKVKVVLDEKLSDLKEGGRAFFKCIVDAKPDDNLSIFWAKYDDRLKELNDRQAVIENLSMEDHLNQVSCVAKNSIGTSKGSANVSILCKSYFILNELFLLTKCAIVKNLTQN